jgi:hypothetical protein
MSVIGDKIGVLALGLTCQTSFRIRAEKALIGKLAKDPAVDEIATPFDWLIVSPAAIKRLLDQNRFVPEHAELTSVEKRAAWPEMGVFFWHEKQRLSDAGYAALRDKYQHKAENLERFKTVKKLIVIVSNTQNDLPMLAEKTGADLMLKGKDLRELYKSLKRFLGRSFQFVVVTYGDRVSGGQKFGKRFVLEPDVSEWKGDPKAWRGLLTDLLGGPPAKLAAKKRRKTRRIEKRKSARAATAGAGQASPVVAEAKAASAVSEPTTAAAAADGAFSRRRRGSASPAPSRRRTRRRRPRRPRP